jgi:hypothetical protein
VKKPEDICSDFSEWPDSWCGVDEDVPYGQGLLDAMRPFITDLVNRGLTKKTIRNHMDNLWLLGGEIIRSVSLDDDYKTPPEVSIRRSVDEIGGVCCRHLNSESQAKSYDATCRKLHKFLGSTERNGQQDGGGNRGGG